VLRACINEIQGSFECFCGRGLIISDAYLFGFPAPRIGPLAIFQVGFNNDLQNTKSDLDPKVSPMIIPVVYMMESSDCHTF
jgi:hypothetical protein